MSLFPAPQCCCRKSCAGCAQTIRFTPANTSISCSHACANGCDFDCVVIQATSEPGGISDTLSGCLLHIGGGVYEGAGNHASTWRATVVTEIDGDGCVVWRIETMRVSYTDDAANVQSIEWVHTFDCNGIGIDGYYIYYSDDSIGCPGFDAAPDYAPLPVTEETIPETMDITISGLLGSECSAFNGTYSLVPYFDSLAQPCGVATSRGYMVWIYESPAGPSQLTIQLEISSFGCGVVIAVFVEVLSTVFPAPCTRSFSIEVCPTCGPIEVDYSELAGEPSEIDCNNDEFCDFSTLALSGNFALGI